MQATQNTINSFLLLSRTQFVIPVYQRPYEWKQEQCQQLLDDILNVAVNPDVSSHFVGSIVFLQLSRTSGNIYSIIDGQQRLTSIVLLLAAIRKRALEQGDDAVAQEIYESYLTDKFMKGGNPIKLCPVKKDQPALRSVIENGTWSTYSRITENFSYFYDRIGALSLDTVRTGIEKLVFVEIGLDEHRDDPQRIFQSLNSTGLDLNQGDLLRNYILMDVPPQKQEQLYEQYWEPIERHTTEHSTNTRKLPDFLRAFLTLEMREIPTEKLVFDTFKKRYHKHNQHKDAFREEILQRLLRYASCYDALINPQNVQDAQVREHLGMIQRLGMTVTYPFLLAVCHDWKHSVISTGDFISVLELVQSYVWRRFVCGAASSALNKIFASLYGNFYGNLSGNINPTNYLSSLERSLVQRKGSQRFPDDDEFMRELSVRDMYNITPKNRLYFFERLENYGKAFSTHLNDNPHVSVEHIFPQKPVPAWKTELGDTDFEEMQKRVNTAANLTLSPLASNAAMSNRTFREKRDLPGDGYRASALHLDKTLADVEIWNYAALQQREQWLLKRCVEVWRYPLVEHLPIDAADEANVLDIDPSDGTGRIVRYATFGEHRLEKPTFADVFAFVVRAMYAREASAFWETDLREKLGVTNDNTKWQSILKIGEGCFIYRNNSAAGVIAKLQAILERCQTAETLTLCFDGQLQMVETNDTDDEIAIKSEELA
jgi:uncharacterized protein with ParB-like and HNH nuclease domain